MQERDMNYSASQRLQLYLAKTGSPTLATSAKWRVDFFLSSKAPFFAYVIFEQQSELGNLWQFRKPEEEPPEAMAQVSEMITALEKLGGPLSHLQNGT